MTDVLSGIKHGVSNTDRFNDSADDIDTAFGTWAGRPVQQVAEFMKHYSETTLADLSGNTSLFTRMASSKYAGNQGDGFEFSLHILPWLLDSGAVDTNGFYNLEKLAAGAYDATFRLFFQRVVAAGLGRMAIRIGHEQNGDWYKHSVRTDAYTGTSSTVPGNKNGGNPNWNNATRLYGALDFIDGYRRIVNIGRSEGWTGLSVFNPNTGTPGASGARWELTYPGNEYVDVVSLDIYDRHFDLYGNFWGTSPTADQITEKRQQVWNALYTEDQGLADAIAFCRLNNKKLAFSEWGVAQEINGGREVGGLDNPIFINKMFDLFVDNRDIIAYHQYFNRNSSIDHYIGPSTTQFPVAAQTFRNRIKLPTDQLSFVTSPTALYVNADKVLRVYSNDSLVWGKAPVVVVPEGGTARAFQYTKISANLEATGNMFIEVPPMTSNSAVIWVTAIRLSGNTLVTLPDGVTKIAADDVAIDSNGWKFSRKQHLNGSVTVIIGTKHFANVSSTTTETLIWGTATNYAAGWIGYSNTTGASSFVIDNRGGVTTSSTNHPMPSTTTTKNKQMVVGVVGGKATSGASRTFTENDDDLVIRVQATTDNSVGNVMAIAISDFVQDAAGATPEKTLSTGTSGFFSVGTQIALNY